MTKKRSMKRALLSSVMSIILCFTMLLGTTFAWFTDSVSSTRNTIQSGNLDIALYYTKSLDDVEWKEVTSETKLFDENALYEPGYTEVVYLKVVNEGSLALKYQMATSIFDEKAGVNKDGGTFYLSECLNAGAATVGGPWPDAWLSYMPDLTSRENVQAWATGKLGETLKVKSGSTYASEHYLWPEGSEYQSEHIVAIGIYMPETIGNEANHKTAEEGEASDKYQPCIDLGINVIATQNTYESDSFDNQYDKDAAYPEVAEVVNVDGNDKAAVLAAIDKAEAGDIVRLSADTTIAGSSASDKLTIEKAVTLDLNGYTLTTECGWGGIDVKGGASIINGTINHTGNTAAIKVFKAEKLENLTINVTETDGKTKGGIVVQNGDSSVGSIKNVTITGATNGIECYRSTSDNAIGRLEGVKIDASENGIWLNGAGTIGKIYDCEIKGGNIGINAYLANVWSISLDIEKSEITGGVSGIDIWDEAATNTGSTVTFNYDDETVFSGDTNTIKVTLQEEITCTINGEEQDTPCNIVK